MTKSQQIENLQAKLAVQSSALQSIAARARFELDHPSELRDTAFSLIEKEALAALSASS